jgi:hypothetical protein
MKLIYPIKGQMVRLVLIVLLNIIAVYSCTVHAQIIKMPKYLGFDVSFGMRTFQVASNVDKINGMQASHEGGSLGIAFGNEFMKNRITVAGVYYSDANTPYTQQLFEMSAATNVYPLTLVKSLRGVRLQPYLTSGLSMMNTKFFGTYIENQDTRGAYEPYLGKVSLLNVKGGLGLEYRLVDDMDFVHLFIEASYAAPGLNKTRNATFSQTTIKEFASISVGVNFGMHR